MNMHELEGLVRSLSYKPGWTFQFMWPAAEFVSDEFHHVVVRARLDDANGTRTQSEVMSMALIPYHADVHNAMYSIHQAIQQLEGHETLEWFRSNGVCVFEPHPNGLASSFATRPAPPGVVTM